MALNIMAKAISLTVDAVVLNDNKILLIQRKRKPFKGLWALPGGFVIYGERVEEACLRELKEETSIDGEIKCLLGVYSDFRRDPRGHVVSVSFLVSMMGGNAEACDDAKTLKWFRTDNLPKLAFDHKQIIEDALRNIR